MEKLDKGEINVDAAKAQASLAKQVNNSLRYEIDRANMLIKIEEHKKNTPDTKAGFRNVEGVNFE
jgi:hypothetical protein